MTLTQLIDFTRRITRTNTTTYSDADITQDLNIAYNDVTARILSKINAYDFRGQIAYADVVDASTADEGEQGYKGMYKYPTDLLKIVRLECKFTTGGISTRLEEQDISAIDTDITDTQAQFYTVFDGALRISPQPTEDVTDGLKIFYEKRQTSLEEDTDVPAYEETFHNILAIEASRLYFEQDPTEANVYRRQAVEQRLAEAYTRLDKFYATKENRAYQLKPKRTYYGS